MRAGVLNLLALQGSTFSRTLTWEIDGQPVNLTGYQARMQIRTVPANIKPARLLLNLNSTNNGLVLDRQNGEVTISISAANTSTLPAGSHVYDLELVSGDYVQRLVQGKFDVSAEVTK
jgi:hypothetical protein